MSSFRPGGTPSLSKQGTDGRLLSLLNSQISPEDSPPGTIRGDYALTIGQNLIHGSDSDESAEREIGVFFAPGEVLGYERDIDRWITES